MSRFRRDSGYLHNMYPECTTYTNLSYIVNFLNSSDFFDFSSESLLRTLRPLDRTKRGLGENTPVGNMANVLDFNTKSFTPHFSFFLFKTQGKGKAILLMWYLIIMEIEGKLIPPFSKQ